MINHGEVEYWQERAIVAEYREKELRSLCDELAVLLAEVDNDDTERQMALYRYNKWRQDNG